ncbi:hypothetical protein AAMO2058_001088400 [Amorphochlora amoebiformis]
MASTTIGELADQLIVAIESEDYREVIEGFKNIGISELRRLVLQKKLVDHWGPTIFQATCRSLADTIRVPSGVLTQGQQRLVDWRRALVDMGERTPEEKKGGDAKEVKAQPTQEITVVNSNIASVEIDVDSYDGEVGAATEWWQGVKQTLLATYPGADKQQWMAVIIKCVRDHPKVKDRLNEFMIRHRGRDGKIDVEEMMTRFTKSYDEHGLRPKYEQWLNLKQGDMNIKDFETKYRKTIRQLKALGHDIDEKQAWMDFKFKVKAEYQVILEKKKDRINSIQDAVKHFHLKEVAEAKSKKEKGFTTSQINAMSTKTSNFGNKPPDGMMRTYSDGKLRCVYCKKTGHAIKTCWDKRDGRPKTTVRDRLNLERSWTRGQGRRGGRGRGFARGRRGRGRGQGRGWYSKNIGNLSKAVQGLVSYLKDEPQEEAKPEDKYSKQLDKVKDLAKTINFIGRGKPKERRKVAVTTIKISNIDEGKTNKMRIGLVKALWDSGNLASKSFINQKAIKRNGLCKDVKYSKQQHTTADGETSFESIGTIKLQLHFKDNIIEEDFYVAPVAHEAILGSRLFERLGAILDFYNGRITLARLRQRGRMSHIPMDNLQDWIKDVANTEDAYKQLPTPEEYQQRYPGKNLKQIIDTLEKEYQYDDWTLQQGRDYDQDQA